MVCLVGSVKNLGMVQQKNAWGKKKAERIRQKIASYETKLVNETNETTRNASKVLKQWDTIHGLLCNSPLPFPPTMWSLQHPTWGILTSSQLPYRSESTPTLCRIDHCQSPCQAGQRSKKSRNSGQKWEFMELIGNMKCIDLKNTMFAIQVIF